MLLSSSNNTINCMSWEFVVLTIISIYADSGLGIRSYAVEV
jgi:hypothetical protein